MAAASSERHHDESENGNQHHDGGHGQEHGRRVQRLAEAHGALVAHPPGDRADATTDTADDQQDRREPCFERELITELRHGRDRHTRSEETEAGSDPGEKGALVGETEAGIRLRTNPVNRTRPASIALGWLWGITHRATSAFRGRGLRGDWPKTTETSTAMAPRICQELSR